MFPKIVTWWVRGKLTVWVPAVFLSFGAWWGQLNGYGSLFFVGFIGSYCSIKISKSQSENSISFGCIWHFGPELLTVCWIHIPSSLCSFPEDSCPALRPFLLLLVAQHLKEHCWHIGRMTGLSCRKISSYELGSVQGRVFQTLCIPSPATQNLFLPTNISSPLPSSSRWLSAPNCPESRSNHIWYLIQFEHIGWPW